MRFRQPLLLVITALGLARGGALAAADGASDAARRERDALRPAKTPLHASLEEEFDADGATLTLTLTVPEFSACGKLVTYALHAKGRAHVNLLRAWANDQVAPPPEGWSTYAKTIDMDDDDAMRGHATTAAIAATAVPVRPAAIVSLVNAIVDIEAALLVARGALADDAAGDESDNDAIDALAAERAAPAILSLVHLYVPVPDGEKLRAALADLRAREIAEATRWKRPLDAYRPD